MSDTAKLIACLCGAGVLAPSERHSSRCLENRSDALAAALEAAEAERDAAQEGWDVFVARLHGAEAERDERLTRESGRALIEEAQRWQKAYDRERAENRRLREALAKVDRHLDDAETCEEIIRAALAAGSGE